MNKNINKYEKIEKLGMLMKQGILTKNEFANEKSKILNNIENNIYLNKKDLNTRYIKILKLGELVKKGTLNKIEFNLEKNKILNENISLINKKEGNNVSIEKTNNNIQNYHKSTVNTQDNHLIFKSSIYIILLSITIFFFTAVVGGINFHNASFGSYEFYKHLSRGMFINLPIDILQVLSGLNIIFIIGGIIWFKISKRLKGENSKSKIFIYGLISIFLLTSILLASQAIY